MNISKYEQRVLHVLAQGGSIHYERGENGKVTKVTCYNRDGHVLADCNYRVFQRLRKRSFVKSQQGQPYRITRLGIRSVRSQLDNR